jgi:glycerophosphoryl diester phosphodiesterase
MADSIESVIVGIENGADGVEVDVRFNRRGKLILSHDRDETGEYPHKPALAEAFELVRKDGRIGINCDVKERETVSAILKLAEETGLGPDQLILTGSSGPSTLEQNREIVKKAAVWFNIEEIINDNTLQTVQGHYDRLIEPITTACLRLGVRVVNMPFREEFIPLIPRFIPGRIQVSVCTLNEAETLKQAFGLGVLNVTTKDSRLALEIRRSTPGHQVP